MPLEDLQLRTTSTSLRTRSTPSPLRMNSAPGAAELPTLRGTGPAWDSTVGRRSLPLALAILATRKQGLATPLPGPSPVIGAWCASAIRLHPISSTQGSPTLGTATAPTTRTSTSGRGSAASPHALQTWPGLRRRWKEVSGPTAQESGKQEHGSPAVLRRRGRAGT